MVPQLLPLSFIYAHLTDIETRGKWRIHFKIARINIQSKKENKDKITTELLDREKIVFPNY